MKSFATANSRARRMAARMAEDPKVLADVKESTRQFQTGEFVSIEQARAQRNAERAMRRTAGAHTSVDVLAGELVEAGH